MDRKKNTTSPYPTEFRERAVRMVEEHVDGYASLTAAVRAVQLGHRVTVFEAARTPGGRARAVPLALPGGGTLVADNGQRVDNSAALRNFQGLQPVNSKVALDVRRDGKPLQLNVALKEGARSADGASLDPRLAGARLAELPEAQRQARGRGGVLVEEVQPGSRAARNQLRPGDVIVATTAGPVADLPALRSSLAQAPQQLVLLVTRGNVQGRLLMQ